MTRKGLKFIYGFVALVFVFFVSAVMISNMANTQSSAKASRRASAAAADAADKQQAPEFKLLRHPDAQPLADRLVTSMINEGGLLVNCRIQEASIHSATWYGLSAENQKMLVAASARYCDSTRSFTMRNIRTSKVLATVEGFYTVVLK